MEGWVELVCIAGVCIIICGPCRNVLKIATGLRGSGLLGKTKRHTMIEPQKIGRFVWVFIYTLKTWILPLKNDDYSSLKLTARTWRLMVGKLLSFLGSGLFSGGFAVSFREGNFFCLQLLSYQAVLNRKNFQKIHALQKNASYGHMYCIFI